MWSTPVVHTLGFFTFLKISLFIYWVHESFKLRAQRFFVIMPHKGSLQPQKKTPWILEKKWRGVRIVGWVGRARLWAETGRSIMWGKVKLFGLFNVHTNLWDHSVTITITTWPWVILACRWSLTSISKDKGSMTRAHNFSDHPSQYVTKQGLNLDYPHARRVCCRLDHW